MYMKHNYARSGVCSGEELANPGSLCVHTSELAKTKATSRPRCAQRRVRTVTGEDEQTDISWTMQI